MATHSRSWRPPTHLPSTPLDLAVSSTSALATLPEVLTAREAATILRVGRNQLYQAVGRGELAAVSRVGSGACQHHQLQAGSRPALR
jgi:hypothetical protein